MTSRSVAAATNRDTALAGGKAVSGLLAARRFDQLGPGPRRTSAVEGAVLAGARVRLGQELVVLGTLPGLVSGALSAACPGGGVTVLASTPTALNQIRPVPENRYRWGSVWDLTDLPLPDASADAVIGSSVLASLGHPRRLLADVARVLRPGGRMSLCEPLLGQRDPIALDGLTWHELTQVKKVLASVQPAAHAFTLPAAVGNARLAGLVDIEHVTDTVTTRLSGASAADAALHAPGPAGESVYQAIVRGLGTDAARRYANAWRSTARRHPLVLTTPIVYLTAARPESDRSPC
ncbi:Methyltransferase domain-containing protein [Parafrankia irregularis]|uniref:Methyltransferase domain-containing protein n=1 Tax=Parafrankia irregularis TaxID=795642 RepID=A0A0S4R136_9ACTN|nr:MULTISPECIES: methyltransferase domain-containing protein [Parafrankia]CUU61252.1 Methyltransferase domain-containing protein [Parafrankia irregularis]